MAPPSHRSGGPTPEYLAGYRAGLRDGEDDDDLFDDDELDELDEDDEDDEDDLDDDSVEAEHDEVEDAVERLRNTAYEAGRRDALDEDDE